MKKNSHNLRLEWIDIGAKPFIPLRLYHIGDDIEFDISIEKERVGYNVSLICETHDYHKDVFVQDKTLKELKQDLSPYEYMLITGVIGKLTQQADSLRVVLYSDWP